uniref:Uncharacterized protein n=1 Tax=Romanomermis culicivorax TaxID=13658 RepID=A0A915L9K0_ROMCU
MKLGKNEEKITKAFVSLTTQNISPTAAGPTSQTNLTKGSDTVQATLVTSSALFYDEGDDINSKVNNDVYNICSHKLLCIY